MLYYYYIILFITQNNLPIMFKIETIYLFYVIYKYICMYIICIDHVYDY